MARAGEELYNPATGERIVFVRTAAQTGGRVLEIEQFWTRTGARTPEHVHPRMSERWHVLSGRGRFRIAGRERDAGVGESVIAPAGIPHVAWNPGGAEVHLRTEFRPALRWEDFLERLFALAQAGEVGPGGVLAPAQLGQLMRDYRDEIAPPR